MASPKKVYESIVSERVPYLASAETLANITLPDLLNHGMSRYTVTNSGGSAGTKGPENSVFNTAGTQSITGLASSLQALLFPANVDWFKLTINENSRQQIMMAGVSETDLDNALGKQSKLVKNFLQTINYQSTVGRIFQRLLIEDNVVVIVTENGIRSIPMRHCAIRRENGSIRYISWFETYVDNQGRDSEIYYLVDYKDGSVWKEDSKDRKPSRVKTGLSAKRVFVVSSAIPDNGSYTCSYGYRHYGLIFTINNLSYNLLRAAAIANKAILFIDESSGLSPQQIAGLESGQTIIGNANALTWLTSGAKITDWSFVNAYLETLKAELSKSFALDILNFNSYSQPRTATEITAISQAIDARVASLAQTVQETFCKNLVIAVIDILTEQGLMPEVLQNITPIVTSGTSSLDRTLEYQKLLQGLATVAQFDPTLVQKIDSVKLLETFSSVTGIPTQDYIRETPVLPPEQEVSPQINTQG